MLKYSFLRIALLGCLSVDPCRNPTLRKCENEIHIPEMGTWESFGTFKSSEFNCKGQNTSHWGVFYMIRKISKCICPKWARMTHLDIYNTSYGQKKGRESNWQFDSRPWKVRNRPDSFACRWRVTRRWKALDEGYNFGLNLVPIGGLHPSLAISRLPFGSPRTKSHADATPAEWCRVYYMGEGGGFPRIRAVVSFVSP
jgi:hypothetical protein